MVEKWDWEFLMKLIPSRAAKLKRKVVVGSASAEKGVVCAFISYQKTWADASHEVVQQVMGTSMPMVALLRQPLDC